MLFSVYLSSTLKDLDEEREAVRQALGDQCVVKHSYRASEDALVESCLDDVAACDLYIGIIGLRYGHVPGPPFPNPKKLSITALEYEHAAEKGIPRLIFIKDEDAIPFTRTDAKTKEHPPEMIERFRKRANSEQRAALFRSLPELREHVLKAFAAFKEKRESDGGETRPEDPPNDEVRRRYVEWLRNECEKVVLLGLDLRDRQNVRLGHVYVPALTVVQSEHLSPSVGRPPGVPTHEPLLHRLGRESLYVPGAPGSGKSTFCRWLALSIASGEVPLHSAPVPTEFQETLPQALRGRFPFLCQLRQWASNPRWLAGNGQWARKQLEDALASWIDETRPGDLTSPALREALLQGCSLVILDGVDEIPERMGEHYPRRNFLTGLSDALPQWTDVGNRVLLTSRSYGIEDAERRTLELPIAELADLSRPLQDVFVHRWYAAAEARDGAAKARGLIEHLDDRPDLDDLRPNPMLLTALCVKYDEDLRLPGDLYRLYSAVTDQVLYKRFNTEPERDLVRLRLSAVALTMHQGTPEHPRTTPAAEVSFEEVDDALTALAESDRASEQSSIAASGRRDSLLSNSGLLVARPSRRAAFYHLSFQEFLAAVRLRKVAPDSRETLARHNAAPEWRRTLRLLFCAIADQASPEQALREYSTLIEYLQPEQLERDPNPALLLADCLEVGYTRRWNLHDFAKPYRQACEHALTRVEPPARAALWQILGRIGLDDRRGVGVRDGVPDIEWVDIPAGQFPLGEDRRLATLPGFRIARYPITHAQFESFLKDRDGFEGDEWWTSLDERRPPDQATFPHPNHPRETVSCFDAMAYCRWLDSRLRAKGELSDGWSVRLPTEHEWETAARGEDGRQYPWGQHYESGRANINEAWDQAGPYSLHQTTPVGIYPQGASPYGLQDMAGNVWEWCLDADEAESRNRTARASVRGGSWNLIREGARTTYRLVIGADSRGHDVGFRVVCVCRADEPLITEMRVAQSR